ncbi:hypothetical protein BKA58DRAFT_471894 [Alternaria rosae]|uniref:uncharacterized protein n=1 Tax=Alternaria rosae TaxID=1187941 RepID=UPI001E8EE1A2|nr:uncharacterized protein BKA58DRAFT_471894 [Alternaria rosae]KAH6865978.1 hypothetical protein BKA58DRAFT_471894 [Alternaria rosae]
MESQPTYLIIGAGVFGVSTAYHLIKKYPNTHIGLIDRTRYPCTLAASWDWNKVIRADYEILKNYEKLGVEVDEEMVSIERCKKMYSSFYDDTDFSGAEEVFVNRDSAWAEATNALTAYNDAAIEAGLKYTAADIDVLTFGTDGGGTRFLTKGGENITAHRIILGTGAITAKLIADSAPNRSELQVHGRLVVGAVVTGLVDLDPKNGQHYTERPVTVHSVLPIRGELIPITSRLSDKDPYTVKSCRDDAYKNTVKHKASGQGFSSPPGEAGQAQKQPDEGPQKTT